MAFEERIRVGDLLPPCELYEGGPGRKVNISQVCRNQKVVLFAVVCAFSPTCTEGHFAGYVSRYEDFKSKGIDDIVCVTVSDVFVAAAFSAHDADNQGKVRVLADPDAVFTSLIGLDIFLPHLGGIRSRRYAMLVVNNRIQKLEIEPDGVGLTCTQAEYIRI